MRKIKNLGLATGLALAAAAGSASAAYGYSYSNGYDNGYNNTGYNTGYSSNGYGRTVRCESRDNRTVYCGVDTSGGVSLVQQISQSSCIRGRTWGADGRGIWVAGGCRGTFAINTGQGGAYGDNGYRSGYDDRNGYDDRSGYDSRYGDGYGNGSGYNGGYSNGAYSGRTIRCESKNGRTRYCSLDTRYGVSLVNQYSHQPCIEGSTWGASGNRVWVTNGCRADFATGSSRYGYNQNGYDPRY